ncbi:MAG: CCA tRNA nucleotidyltransferase [Sulfurospirillum sp.]
MSLIKNLPPHLKIQFEKVQNFLKNHTNRAYLSGGGVRDLVMKQPLKDLDIEVYDIDDMHFDCLMKRLGAKGVGKSFFVYKLGDIDISLPRVERKNGIGHKAFEVELCDDEKEASKRRDFTMNAMMLDIFDYKLLDFYGGLKSIESKTISLVDETSFKDDSLRVLRAVQFSSRLGFKIDEKTLGIMDEISLEDLSNTRIFWELEKLFYASNLHFGLYYMYRLHLFEKLFVYRAEDRLFCKCALELGRANASFEKDIYPYYFLYVVVNILGFSISKILKSIEAPRHFERALKNQPFYDGDVNDKQLKTIAIDMPLKEWLGNYKKGVKKRAQELDIWDKRFDGGIKISDVISEGFEKDEIKKEYKRRVLGTI